MKYIKFTVYSILFILFLTAVFIGQKNTGYFGLGLITVGIVGLIILLWTYNRNFERNN